MRLLHFGSLIGTLSIAEWFVWAALVVLFGKQALVVAIGILRWLTVALAALAIALIVLVTVAFVAAHT